MVRRPVKLISHFFLFYQINGEWQTEIIRDQAVIRAYVRGRQAIEEEATLADSLAPTGDADKDNRAKKRYNHRSHQKRKDRGLLIYLSHVRLGEEIARMKKNQERRLHRKNAKIVKEGGTPMQLNRPVKPDTTVSVLADQLSIHHQKKGIPNDCAFYSHLQRRCGHCNQMGHMSMNISHICPINGYLTDVLSPRLSRNESQVSTLGRI